MDLRVTCFLSLTLLLDVAGAQGNFKMLPTKLEAKLGEKIKLECEVLTSTASGCSWLFESRSSQVPNPTFIAYVSLTRSKLSEKLDPKLFNAHKQDSKYILTLSKFSPEHEGYYFCAITSNSMLHFSPLVPVFLPAKPTIKPVTRPSTPVPPIGTSQPLRPGACRPGAGGSG